MWKVVAAQSSHSSCLFVTLSSMVIWLFFMAAFPTSSLSLPLSHSGNGGGMVGGHTSSMSSSSSDLTSGVDLAQIHNLFREALKYFQKVSSNPSIIANTNKGVGGGGGPVPVFVQPAPPVETTRISGQVNQRYPRSELNDVAMKLLHLQEMDKLYGAKARPRFGKRNEVTQDNFIPIYGDEELKDSSLGANGDGYPVAPQFIFIP